MSRHPLLLFPKPSTTSPSTRNGGGDNPHLPSVTRQSVRLEPIFSRLESALENKRIQVQSDTFGVDPEYTVVIETFCKVSDFFKVVRKIEGLEWLSEYELREIEPDDDFYYESDRSKPLNGQVMLMLSDRRAIDELLSLWRRYGKDPKMEFSRGWAKFRDLFRLLKDIRYWNTQDRLGNTGIVEDWKDRLKYEPDSPIRFEAELWFRVNESKRNIASDNVTRLTRELGGKVISTCCLPDIHYQSLLLELPANQVERILNQDDVLLVRCDQVMLFRPLGQMSAVPLWSDEFAKADTLKDAYSSYEPVPAKFERQPRVALLDGLPLANHLDLHDSLIIDDPDNFEMDYSALHRVHGTAMASLIVNGDLTNGEEKLATPLYVRPIMRPNPRTRNNAETLPDNELPLDIIHRAVKRIFEGDGNEHPVVPSIKIINLSIADPNIHFNGQMSPFARLLDWLSFKYNVLFVVSAGNHVTPVTVSHSGREFHQLTDDVKAIEFFRAVQKDSWARKLLSPAESVNAITVGSLHSDESSFSLRSGLYDIYSEEMPAAYSSQGNGYLRSVKPDIVMSGGRILYNEAIGGSNLTVVNNYAAPGQQVAHPHSSAFNHRVFSRGTSNSAALTSRGCAEICDVLEKMFAQNEKVGLFEQYSPLLLKSLITHSASWGAMYDRISAYMEKIDSKSPKNAITRNIGYGKPDLDRAKFCLGTRATILGFGDLKNDEAHVYKLPIPQGMRGVDIWRRLTVTLSWFVKPCSGNMKYRDSALWFTLEGDNKDLASRCPSSVDWMQVRRGTLQHEIFEGKNLKVITEDTLEIKVNCKEHASKIIEPIRYGLAITLEVAEGVNMRLYEEIQEVVNEQIREQERARNRQQVPTR